MKISQLPTAGPIDGTEQVAIIQGLPGAEVTKRVPVADFGQGPPGKSAYEVAVDNGYVGTEAEWNASVNSARTAAEGARDAALAAKDEAQAAAAKVQITEDNPAEFTVADEVGRVVMIVGEDGAARFVAVNSPLVSAATVAADTLNIGGEVAVDGSSTNVEALVDGIGRAVRVVDADGTHRMVAVSTKRLTVEESVSFPRATIADPVFRSSADRLPVAYPASEIVHISYYGQSWSLGFDSIGALTTAQRHATLMFNGGVRQLSSVASVPTALQSFVPAVEAQTTGSPEFPAAVLGETGAVAMAHTIMDLIEQENNIPFADAGFQLLVSAPGEGSKQIEQLADNAQPYILRLKEQISRGYAIAQGLGKSYVFAAVTWLQGSSSIGTLYADQLEAMRVDIDTYAKAVTGQTQDVKLITWQQYPNTNADALNNGSARGVYTRFVGAADTYPNIVVAGPSYQHHQISAANIHYDAVGMHGIGEALGLAIKRELFDGENFEPLRPMTITRQGVIGLVRLNVASGTLVADTTQVVARANLGFSLYTSGGAALTLSSAAIIGPNLVKLVAAAPIPADAILRYADVGTDATDALKWRGNIRDNTGDFGGADRWLVAFSLPFDN